MKTLLKFFFGRVKISGIICFKVLVYDMKLDVLNSISKNTLGNQFGLKKNVIKGLDNEHPISRTFKMLRHRYALSRYKCYVKEYQRYFRMLHTLTHSYKYTVKFKDKNYFEDIYAIGVGEDDNGKTQFMSKEILLIDIDKNVDISELNQWQNQSLCYNVDKAMMQILQNNLKLVSIDPDFNNKLESKLLKQINDDTFSDDVD